MTRDEAKKKLNAVGSAPGEYKPFDETMIDTLSALGILKLDEPKAMPQRLREFIRDTRLVHGGELERLDSLHTVLAEHGLRIVEK